MQINIIHINIIHININSCHTYMSIMALEVLNFYISRSVAAH